MVAGEKLGVCTWTFGPLSLEKIIRSVASLKLDGIELLGDIGAESPASVVQMVEDAGLCVFSLTPINVDIAHPDARIRDAGITYYKKLVDFSAELGRPIVSVHGHVGRIAAINNSDEELALLTDAVHKIAGHARAAKIDVVFEVLNRYETHLINNAKDALDLLRNVNAENLGVLLDAYHMNIEEARLTDAIKSARHSLKLFHAADSNRQAIGRGHTDFSSIARTLDEVGYDGPVIFECTAPGPNPFTPVKGPDYLDRLETFLEESKDWWESRVA